MLIVAHRGCKKPFRENTLEAFQYALDQGCKAVEMDVRFDYWHKRFFLEHDRFHLPSKRRNLLENIVQELPENITIFVELKTIGWLSDRFARHFLETYRKLFKQHRTVIISFNPFALLHLKKLEPEMALGFLCGNPLWNFFFQKLFWKKMRPHYFLLHKRLLKEKNVRFGRQHSMKVFSFVLNREEDWDKAKTLHLDGITTDHPAALRDYLHRESN